MTHEANKALHAASSTGRDAGNRLTGLLARAGSVFEPEDLDDSLIVERVRAKMGRVASHPHLVHVASSNGEVSLSGTVPANELDELISTASKVRGVIKVQSRLEPRQSELELLHP
ncbi:MAG TPA: BON domain-containing protein [Blastocatellia bacterium]|nr:BON domain-containing protein [Blastocatellia bacterium]